MKVKCQKCHISIDSPFHKIGTIIECPACGQETLLKPDVDERYSATGEYLTYDDFIQLLTYPPYKRVVAPLIAEWFDCQVLVDHGRLRLRKKDGTDLVPQFIHDAIQEDPRKRQKIYRYAMSLWH